MIKNYAEPSSQSIPVVQIINWLHVYQDYTITTRWYVTSSSKLVYSLLIAKPNGYIDSYYFDIETRYLVQLSREEYNNLKPSDISTYGHQVVGNCRVFTIVEFYKPEIPIFQYILDFPANIIQITNVFNIPIIAAESTQQAQALSEGSLNEDNGAAATTTEDKSGSSSVQNGSTNLSNQASQNNFNILESFKENEPESLEFTISSTIVSLDDLDTIDKEKKEYQENKEAADRRYEEQYLIKVQVEGFNDKVNITYHNPEIDTSGLLKPLLGEHDLGVKMPSFIGYSA